MGKLRLKINPWTLVVYIILIIVAVVIFTPFWVMISSSFKTNVELMRLPIKFFPAKWQFGNYSAIFLNYPFLIFFRNTLIITTLRTVAQILFCSMAAFAFAKIPFKGSNVLFLCLLAVLMIPPQMILVPNYLIMKHLHLIDTVLGVALPGMFSAFGMFLLKQFYMTLPDELIEAGRIDGCNYFTIFRKLLFPLTKPAIISLTIFTIMYSWNDLLWPLIISSSDSTRPLSVGIALMQGQNVIQYNQIIAAAVLVILPLVILFSFFQKYYVEGIAMSGIKK